MKNSTKFIIGIIGAIALLGLYPIYMFKSNFDYVEKNRVIGSGDLSKKTLALNGFEELEIMDDFDVILRQGDFKVETEMDANLEELLDFEVKEDRLQIKFEKGTSYRSSETPKVWVTMPELRRAILFSSGSFKNEGTFTGSHVEVQIMGSGEMDLNFECETVKASIMGSGEIELDGTGDFLEISIPGSGEVEAEGFSTVNANIRISGSGEANVNASGHLDASIMGSGAVRYSGNPASVNKQISGSGDVTKI